MFMNETWTPAPIITLKVSKNSRDVLSLSNLSMKKLSTNMYLILKKFPPKKQIPSPDTHVMYLNRGGGGNMRIFYYNF
jgi:hypothetical protein